MTRQALGVGPLVALAVGATTLFGMLVTANSAGYRYGASDQAFYIPAVLRAMSPALFPHDAALIDSQSRLTLSNELLAALSRVFHIDLPALFLAGYLSTIVLFVAGVALVGSALYRSWWSTAALGLTLTLRHRIAGTGVNTFEGYFHPRALAFALGLLGIGALWRGRRLTAAVVAAAAFAVHPTTGLWFAMWIAPALMIFSGRTLSPRLGTAAALTVLTAALWAFWRGPLVGSVVIMDPAWADTLSDKGYLFPTDWPADVWLTNAIAPCILAFVYRWRRRAGLVSTAEAGVVAGSFALLAFFAATLPFVHLRVALAVQLQTSRVLWPVEFLATVYLVWALVEAPWRWPVSALARSRAVVAALLVAALVRGAYVLRVEHTRPLGLVDLPRGPWQDAAEWAERHTPLDAYFLADPVHALKYGTSFRVAARRDVFLEATKDTAMSAYSRQVAVRVQLRVDELADFANLTEQRALALAAAHDLDYLISERRFALPEVYANDQFHVYALRP